MKSDFLQHKQRLYACCRNIVYRAGIYNKDIVDDIFQDVIFNLLQLDENDIDEDRLFSECRKIIGRDLNFINKWEIPFSILSERNRRFIESNTINFPRQRRIRYNQKWIIPVWNLRNAGYTWKEISGILKLSDAHIKDIFKDSINNPLVSYKIKNSVLIRKPSFYYAKGENHPFSKLKKTDILWLWEKRYKGASINELAKIINVSFTSVQRIFAGRTWKHVEVPELWKKEVCSRDKFYYFQRGEKHSNSKLTNNQVLKIKQDLKRGLSHNKLAQLNNVSKRCIQHIAYNVTWKWL